MADGADAVALEAGIQIAWTTRARTLARETVWLVEQLEAERSARTSIQAQRDALLPA